MLGCTNPKAVNYNPAATEDNGTCVYLETSATGQCLQFKDVPADQLVDESFTLSYSFDGKDWVFFHDYFPDMYFSTRKALYSLKNGKIYKHNEGTPGVYYDTQKSFFIDAVFASNEDATLNSLQWLTEVMGANGELEFSTLSHITVWNGQQCTGRIALSELFHPEDLEFKETRKTQSLWSFNAFRDVVKDRGTVFLKDLFNNFAVDATALSNDLPWYEQRLLEGNYFIVRFEFDNTKGDIILHGVDCDLSKSYR